MKIKILKSTIFLFIICASFSCSRNDLDVEDPLARKAILGKWELIADGETEDNMYDRSDGNGFWTDEEYLSDGTLLLLDSHSYPVGVVQSGTFKIYADSLVRFFNGTGSSQKYSFSGDTLYLSVLHYSPPPSGDGINTWVLVYSPRYFIYKRKN